MDYDIIKGKIAKNNVNNVIINQIKNEGNGNAFYKMINKQNISETFVFPFLKCVMDSIPTLLENKKECYAIVTSQLHKYLL